MIVARCYFILGGVLDMAARDSADVDRIRAEIVAGQQRRDPISGSKALMDRQQQVVGQMMQQAMAITEGGPQQETLELSPPPEALAAFEHIMDAVPEPPDGYSYTVASTGRLGWLTPEGLMQVRNVEDVEVLD